VIAGLALEGPIVRGKLREIEEVRPKVSYISLRQKKGAKAIGGEDQGGGVFFVQKNSGEDALALMAGDAAFHQINSSSEQRGSRPRGN